jgi:hypothetical protein
MQRRNDADTRVSTCHSKVKPLACGKFDICNLRSMAIHASTQIKNAFTSWNDSSMGFCYSLSRYFAELYAGY